MPLVQPPRFCYASRMAPNERAPSVDRHSTDSSLRTERRKTDDELAKGRSDVGEDADTVVRRARVLADETLRSARVKAEVNLKRGGASDDVLSATRREQAIADASLASERVVLSQELDKEREQQRRALASLLLQERHETDKHLLIERARSDQSLLNRDDFLGMVSHDLRNILGGIAMRAAQLIKIASKDEAGRETLELAKGIERASGRMGRLTLDLIDVTSIESGRLAVRPVEQDARRVIEESMEAFGSVASARGVSLRPELSDGPLLARFDFERVLQVVENLISNAIKFAPAKGQIQLRAEQVGKEVRFSVSDSGTGIPPEKREAIFERFWQVTPNDQRGLGLGLFISRCLVEAHGGRIWVESSSGKGNTFAFTLPGASPTPSR